MSAESTISLINQNKDKWTKNFFIFFFLSVGLHKCNYLISVYTGINIQNIILIPLLAFPLFFLILSNHKSSIKFSIFKELKQSPLPVFILSYGFILLIYGALRRNNLEEIFWDLYPAAIIFLSYKLSRNEEIWSVFAKLPLLLIMAVAVLLGVPIMRGDFETVGLSEKLESVTTATVAYDISPILDFWPFFFMFFFFRKEMKWKTLSFLPVIIYVLFQLFFLKRAPTARAFGFVTLAASIQIFSNKLFSASTLFRILFAVLLMGLVIANLPEELMDRFKTEDTTRQEESAHALRSFNPLEHIFGRGLGGWYELSEGAGVVENNYGPEKKSGKSITHIGIVYVYLKGGLILFFLILFHVLSLIIRGFFRLKKFGKWEQMSWIFLVIYSIFRLIEGPMSTGALFDACLFGLAVGRLDFSLRTQVSKEPINLSVQNRNIYQ